MARRPGESVAVCVPTNEKVDEVVARLSRRGIMATKITGDGARGGEGVHVGTMYRFKGLEYRRMIIAGVSAGLVPRSARGHLGTDRQTAPPA
ncbi:hypothetical protein ACFFS2_18240 [Streptomyces aurantiacus]|uniref:Uncharacterized protein n=1 Tax=Streptomyces aurantiacus TaxID=47760 RepID=A0A7G1NUS4_9ACTN|nr:hypothetical protein [Streptomyces aurantiacus]BCL27113.1 hypothetical protein GCM10017557_19720 [Streptomyces aurantiacus]